MQFLLAMQGIDVNDPVAPDIRHAKDFAAAFRSAYNRKFRDEPGPYLDEAGAKWADSAAWFLRDLHSAHSATGADEPDPFAWAKAQFDLASSGNK